MKFKVVHQDGKGFTWYSEESNHFFKQSFNWWEKGGYTIPQTKKEITKDEFTKMYINM